ncbi:Uma2 family endonuclease [Streptomyces sp. WMMC500]|uniref:Uma2 family endonuclease n=1 Tax=Streptomyces sp. WMMC500 TaxID=3015154 RepID=UPI00248BF945|nr:Uma2 family endonuclease [Streptomyces sp. WMMC500]WBB58426.1 Uma2 family endonuclease [Streptomyces sp. WMMC500]
MTVMAERTAHTPQMTVEEFEEIAKAAEKLNDAVRFEFIDGRIGVKGVPDGDHNEIVGWLLEECVQSGNGLRPYTSDLGLEVEKYRTGRAKPDLAFAPKRSFTGQGDWADPAPLAMVVEVTSYDSDTNRRDRQDKPAAYAAAGIPVFLLIDRDACTLTAYSEPSSEGYHLTRTAKFGEKLALPKPVGIELDTEELKDYIR